MRDNWARQRWAPNAKAQTRKGTQHETLVNGDAAPRRRKGPRKRAKTLDDSQFETLLEAAVAKSNVPESDALKLLLSYLAGLRASEIASLDMRALTDPDGRISKSIWISGAQSKNGREREIPMHPCIRDALQAYRKRYPGNDYIAISSVNLTGPMETNALTVWFHRLYRKAGFADCSSHSGRRTFITNLAQRANRFHSSLADVQRLAGHARLDTTSAYIAPSEDTSAMISSLGTEPRKTHRLGQPKRPSYDW
jgi:integrase/recombinase XerD